MTRPNPTESRLAPAHPRAYLIVHAIGGVFLMGICVWAFAALADELPEQGWMERLDHSIVSLVQARGTGWGERAFSVITLLGSDILAVIAVIAVIAVLAVCRYLVRRDWFRTGVLSFTVLVGSGINALLKQIFHRGRPEYASEFIARRRVLLVVAATLIALVGISRVYLGVHYFSDVLAGWLAGAVWLTVGVSGYRFARREREGVMLRSGHVPHIS